MRLVLITEIAQILKIRDIGFCDDDRVFRSILNQQPDQLDDQVGLREVDTWGTQLFPEESNRIEPEPRNTMFKITTNDFQKLDELKP